MYSIPMFHGLVVADSRDYEVLPNLASTRNYAHLDRLVSLHFCSAFTPSIPGDNAIHLQHLSCPSCLESYIPES